MRTVSEHHVVLCLRASCASASHPAPAAAPARQPIQLDPWARATAAIQSCAYCGRQRRIAHAVVPVLEVAGETTLEALSASVVTVRSYQPKLDLSDQRFSSARPAAARRQRLAVVLARDADPQGTRLWLVMRSTSA